MDNEINAGKEAKDVAGYYTKRSTLNTVCALTSDRNTLVLADWWEMRPEGRASQFLDHYLCGKGTPQYIDINTLLREDLALTTVLQERIASTLRASPHITSGKVGLEQGVFGNKDWRFATGAINMDWKLIARDTQASTVEVELSFKDEYRWHPGEKRTTQCVHQAADRQRQKGAKNFMMVGRPTKIKIYIPRAGR